MIDGINYILECNFNSLFVLLLLIRLVICQCLSVIAQGTRSFEVKIEADSSDVTDYVQGDKPRTNIGTKRSLKVHKSTNNGEKQYRCTVCDKRFTTKRNLTIHSRRHTGEHLYSCSQCEKRFSSPTALCSHKNIHTSKYKCTECGKCCNNSKEVAVHRRLGEVIQDINHLNVLFVANDSQHQVTLLSTAELTVERNRTNVTCVTRRLVRLEV